MTDQPQIPASHATPDPRIAELERRLADQEAAHQARIVQSELKSHALRAGMIDLDGLKLLDPAAIKLTPKGEIEGADHLMTELRRTKPWLFHAATTSTPAAAPPTTQPTVKRATAMAHAEWQTARAELLRRR
jgi:hypothetical protein